MLVVGRTPLRKRRTKRKNSVFSFFPWRAEPTTIAPEAKPELADAGVKGQSSRGPKEKVCPQKVFAAVLLPSPTTH